jgi:hypothetical protein
MEATRRSQPATTFTCPCSEMSTGLINWRLISHVIKLEVMACKQNSPPFIWGLFCVNVWLAARKMGKSAVGFGHLVGVFLFLKGSTGFIVGVDDLER